MRKLLLVGMLVTCSILLNAQKFSGEPYLGVNDTWLSKTSTGIDHEINWQGGLSGRYSINDRFSVALGLGVSDRRKQYAYSDTAFALEQYGPIFALAGIDIDEIDSTLSALGFNFDQITNTSGMAKIFQLEIPISLRYQFKFIDVEAGGYLGFNMSVKKYESIVSDIPLLQAVDVSQIDTSGTFAMFFPPAHAESERISENSDQIANLTYGLKLGVGYTYPSHLRIFAAFHYDMNKYLIDESPNLLSNNKYFLRFGISYEIKSLWVNKNSSKASFE